MDKKIETLLSSLEEAADNFDELNTETMFEVGDVVTFDLDGVASVGVIEDEDKTGYHVRVYAQAGNDYEPTDKVLIKEEGDLELHVVEEKSTGTHVTWNSAEGKTFGVITAFAKTATVEVYTEAEDGFKATGVSVEIPAVALKTTYLRMSNSKPKIMAKMADYEMEIDEEKNIGIIRGKASTYGNVDLGGDSIPKGAYTQTLAHKNGRVKFLFDHGWMTRDIAGVAFLKDSDSALMLEGHMPLDASDVKDAFTKVKFLVDNGVDMGLSIGYDAIKTTHNADGTRTLNEIALHEVSLTPWPMDTQAQVLEARAKRVAHKAKSHKWATLADASTKDSQPEQGADDDLSEALAVLNTTLNEIKQIHVRNS